MTGLTLGDLSELDIELNIADSRTVTEVFREVVGGGDGSAVLGRGTAASAADAAERDKRAGDKGLLRWCEVCEREINRRVEHAERLSHQVGH